MKARISTISLNDAKQWASKAELRKTLFCRNIPGLHLIRLKGGVSWRWRYENSARKIKMVTIGRFPVLSPEAAAQQVLKWQMDGVDPLREKAESKKASMLAHQKAESRVFRTYLGQYEKHLNSRKRGNAKIDLGRLHKHFGHLMDRDLAELDGPTDIRPWQNQMKNQQAAAATVTRAYNCLKSVLAYAVRDGVIEKDPLSGFKLDRPNVAQQNKAVEKRREGLRRPLTEAELKALYGAIETFDETFRKRRRNSRSHGKAALPDLDSVAYAHWFKPFFFVALYTGMRAGDLYGLDWRDLDLAAGRLVKTTEKSMHNKSIEIQLTIAAQLGTVLKKWNNQQGKPKAGLVFRSPKTGQRLSQDAHQRHWKTVRELAGISNNLNFYALRHNWISQLIVTGTPILMVAKMAGHTSAEMIEKSYGHLIRDSADEAISRLEGTFPTLNV